MQDSNSLDPLDRHILAALAKDGRVSMTALGQQVGLSKTPVTARVRRLEALGVITGYRAELSAQKLGLEHVAFIEVKLSDTSDAAKHLPLYTYASLEELTLPRGCALVGVELTPEAAELPSFRHPAAAAYVLGPERGSLSPALIERCDFVVQIPTKFCVNLGTAGAIVMYDRMISRGRFARRPVNPRSKGESLPPHVQGAQIRRGN